MEIIKKISRNNLFRKMILFCTSGGITTLVDMIFFNIFYIISFIFVLSRIGGILVSLLFNFNFNRNITFKAKGKKARHQLWKYVILYGFSMTSNVLVGKLVLFLLNGSLISANIAAISGLAVSVPINFLGLMFWVFKE